MIFLAGAENHRLLPADLVEMCRQRETLFVDRAGWEIPVIGDMEIDAYDRADTLYLLAKDRPATRYSRMTGIRQRSAATIMPSSAAGIPLIRGISELYTCHHAITCRDTRGTVWSPKLLLSEIIMDIKLIEIGNFAQETQGGPVGFPDGVADLLIEP